MQIKIIRSDKRRKTVRARKVGDILEISAPAHLSDTELQPIIQKLTRRIERREQKQQLDDADLARIAGQLNQQFFQNRLAWNHIAWSTHQDNRYGSCTPARQTIRISYRLVSMPRFVLEYVVMHELANLVESNHGPGFWGLVNRYPWTERARGYLMAVGLEDIDHDPDDLQAAESA